MMICADYDPDCYACNLRRKGVMLSSSASPTRRNSIPPRTTPEPSWEKGIAVDRRRNGEVMPLLDASASRTIPIKEYGEKRHQYDDALRRLKGPVT